MNATDTLALLPLLLLAGTAVVVMLGIAVKRSHELTAGLTLTGLAASFLSVCAVAPLVPRQVTSLLLIDRYALFYLGLIIASAAAVAVLSYQYFAKHDGQREELYLLLVLATLGCGVLVTSVHFASFLLGLEVLSISLYGMVAYFTGRGQALEAGIKYLILASASAAFLLFGMALIYADTGTMAFSSIRDLSLGGVQPRAPAAGYRTQRHRHRVQTRRGALPSVDTGRISGRPGAGVGFRRDHIQDRGGGAAAALSGGRDSAVSRRCSCCSRSLRSPRCVRAISLRCGKTT